MNKPIEWGPKSAQKYPIGWKMPDKGSGPYIPFPRPKPDKGREDLRWPDPRPLPF